MAALQVPPAGLRQNKLTKFASNLKLWRLKPGRNEAHSARSHVMVSHNLQGDGKPITRARPRKAGCAKRSLAMGARSIYFRRRHDDDDGPSSLMGHGLSRPIGPHFSKITV